MEKVDEIDLNGNSVAEEAGQSENTEVKEEKVEETVETKAEPEETIESLKEKLRKTEEEKENYKKGMLSAKGKTLKAKEETEEEETTEDYPEWDENSKKFQEQTAKQAESIAEKKAREIVENYNEKSAIAKFISQHPELGEDAKWNEVISNYHPKNGKETTQAIERDLERAYFLTRYENGEISNLEREAFEKGEKKGKSESQVADMSSISSTTQKSVKNDGKSVSEGALRLAQAMRVDPTKLADEDDSLTAEIQL